MGGIIGGRHCVTNARTNTQREMKGQLAARCAQKYAIDVDWR